MDYINSETVDVIKKALHVPIYDITNISVLKKGMTNRSFLFVCKGKRYIMRVPGEGTDKLISREQEYEVYRKIEGLNICDNVVYFNSKDGCKISEYLEDARVCDVNNKNDVQLCMQKLRFFHELNLQVPHTFDIFEKINFYESLWGGKTLYEDYESTKLKVFELKDYIDAQEKQWTLVHIDAVPDNFLFVGDGEKEEVRLIDWEYAGMQDACVDIAMFAIYAMYEREEVEYLIDTYYQGECGKQNRLKIYCYIAACGLLWSNWCEYKRQLGIEFGEYSLRQYCYAKEYYEIFQMERQGNGKK